MQSLDQFIAEQQKALEAKKREIESLAQLGEVPGLTPWLVHTPFRGYKHIAFKVEDLPRFVEWVKPKSVRVLAFKSRYAGMWPHVPEGRDYDDATITGDGDVLVKYSTIMREFHISVFIDGYQLSFKLTGHHRELIPVARYRDYSDRYRGQRKVEAWTKPEGRPHECHLFPSVDKQSADMSTLLSWEQFESYFTPQSVTA